MTSGLVMVTSSPDGRWQHGALALLDGNEGQAVIFYVLCHQGSKETHLCSLSPRRGYLGRELLFHKVAWVLGSWLGAPSGSDPSCEQTHAATPLELKPTLPGGLRPSRANILRE